MDGVPFRSLINCPHTNVVCVPLYILFMWPVIYFTRQVMTEESNKPGNDPPFLKSEHQASMSSELWAAEDK